LSLTKTANLNQSQVARIIALAMLIFLPLVFLPVMYIVEIQEQTGGQIDMTQYILLIIGVLQPLTIPLITRVQVQFWQKSVLERKNPASLFLSLALIKYLMIVAIYIYSLVVYFLSGDMIKALYFYPIGMVWSVVHWPTRQRFENSVSRLSEK